jgi:hypothetical protein
MNAVAMWVGYAAMAAAGIGLVGFLLALALNYLWERMKSAHGMNRVARAIRSLPPAESKENPHG